MAEPTYRGDLGQGLRARWSTADDCARIGQLMATVFRASPEEPLSPRLLDEARMLMSEDFPVMGPGDFALVEDAGRAERPLVACTCLFRHTWSYAGIPFGVGRPEVVATDPAYRNRGLVRALLAMVHARSSSEGHLLQAITGIPHFYRQFGYEYVLDLGGHRRVEVASLAVPADKQVEVCTLRLATEEDIGAIDALYRQRRQASLVWHEAKDADWRFLITSWEDPAVAGKEASVLGLERRLYVVRDGAGATQGFLSLAAKRTDGDLRVSALELAPGINWQVVMPCLLRTLRQLGEATPAVAPDTPPFSAIRFGLGRSHPAYDILGERLAPRVTPPYAWYLRVPDLPAFLWHIAPALEARLAASALAGHTGDLTVDLYRSGLHLRFEQGHCTAIDPWRAPAYGDVADAGCPPLTFLQLLFGYRSRAALQAIFPDFWASEDAALLIDTLFPALPSTVYPLG